MASEAEVREVLGRVRYPGQRRDIVTLGIVREVTVEGARVVVKIAPGTRRGEVVERIREDVETTVRGLGGVGRVDVVVLGEGEGEGAVGKAVVAGARHVIAVASTKGGVGKSTVAANLAIALAEHGPTALLDADVYGPSLPMLMGAGERPGVSAGRLRPVECHGVRLMSLGFFLDERSPVIWRGPLVAGLVRQFLHDVGWGTADYLVVDLPPGTGDAPLTLVQQVALSGAVVVTTAQEVSLLDVGRGVAMLEQLGTPLLGVVVNMSGYRCPRCGTEDRIFGRVDAHAVAARFGAPLLAEVPLTQALRESGDRGFPLVRAAPDDPVSRAFRKAARRVVAALDSAGSRPPG